MKTKLREIGRYTSSDDAAREIRRLLSKGSHVEVDILPATKTMGPRWAVFAANRPKSIRGKPVKQAKLIVHDAFRQPDLLIRLNDGQLEPVGERNSGCFQAAVFKANENGYYSGRW